MSNSQSQIAAFDPPVSDVRLVAVPDSRQPQTVMIGLVAVLVLIGGVTPVAARMAVAEIPPLTLAWARFGVASGLLWITLRIRRTPMPWRHARPSFWLGMALLLVPVNQLGFLWGIKLSSGSHAGVVYALMPVLVFWLSVAVGRRRYDGLMLLAALLAFAAAASVALPDLLAASNGATATTGRDSTASGGGAVGAVASSGMQPAWSIPAGWRVVAGVALLFVAVSAWAGFLVASQSLIERVGALPVLTAVLLLGAALQTPLMLLDVGGLGVDRLTWRGAAGFTWLTLITVYIGYLLFYVVLARFDATRLLIFINMQFMVTVLIEWIAYGEQPTGWFVLGCALVLAAVALDRVRVIRTRAPACPLVEP